MIIDHGRTIAQGSPAELKAQVGGDRIEAHPRRRDQANAVAEQIGIALGTPAVVEADTGKVSAPVSDGTHSLAAIVRNLDAAGLVVDDLGVRRPTLDEVFLALTGRPSEDAA